MVGSIAISPQELDSGRRTIDGIARATFWKDRGCVSSSYRLIRISANNIVRANFWRDSRCANCSYGLAVGSIAIRLYHCMGSLNSWRHSANCMKAVFGRTQGVRIINLGSWSVA